MPWPAFFSALARAPSLKPIRICPCTSMTGMLPPRRPPTSSFVAHLFGGAAVVLDVLQHVGDAARFELVGGLVAGLAPRRAVDDDHHLGRAVRRLGRRRDRRSPSRRRARAVRRRTFGEVGVAALLDLVLPVAAGIVLAA